MRLLLEDKDYAEFARTLLRYAKHNRLPVTGITEDAVPTVDCVLFHVTFSEGYLDVYVLSPIERKGTVAVDNLLEFDGEGWKFSPDLMQTLDIPLLKEWFACGEVARQLILSNRTDELLKVILHTVPVLTEDTHGAGKEYLEQLLSLE